MENNTATETTTNENEETMNLINEILAQAVPASEPARRKHVFKNKKTDTSGSSRRELKHIQPGQFITVNETTYQCEGRVTTPGRHGTITLTLRAGDGTLLTLEASVPVAQRRSSIAEMLAFKARRAAGGLTPEQAKLLEYVPAPDGQ